MIVASGRQEAPGLSFGVPAPNGRACCCVGSGPTRSRSVPGGQRGGRMQRLPACPPLWVPRGQAASGGTQTACPFSISATAFPAQGKAAAGTPPAAPRPPPPATPPRETHEAEPTSSTSRSPQGRNMHPSRLMRAAGPQKESPTAGGTHAPSTGTVSPVHSQSPEEGPRAASRGQAVWGPGLARFVVWVPTPNRFVVWVPGRSRFVVWVPGPKRAAAAAPGRGGPAGQPMAPKRAKARAACQPFAERRTG